MNQIRHFKLWGAICPGGIYVLGVGLYVQGVSVQGVRVQGVYVR